uniref:Ig-like domain-containing protein n=1 Tax=Labrus bergylta TaxID=56723 RepID=A0A3Q3F594_9LABR
RATRRVKIYCLNAGQIKAQPEVTGYVGHDVTLPCPLIKNRAENISQVEWKLQQPNCSEISIIVFISREQFTVKDTFLKDRVEISEQSLIIRDVKMRDAGSYTCSLSAFPSGILEGTTTLVVLDQMYAAVMLKDFSWTHGGLQKNALKAAVCKLMCSPHVGVIK